MDEIYIVTTCDDWRSNDSMRINNIVTVTESPDVVARSVRSILDTENANGYEDALSHEEYTHYSEMDDNDLFSAAVENTINGIHVTVLTKDEIDY